MHGQDLPATHPAGGSYWWSSGDPGPARPPLRGRVAADVAIVGGGFTGLWAAIRLLETDPSLAVVVLEAERAGWGASGRNGGFCDASLTHGLANGLLHFPDEIDLLEAEGRRNLAEIAAFVSAERLDAELEETGQLVVASQPHEVDGLRAYADAAGAHGMRVQFLDRDQVQALQPSPRWLAGAMVGGDQCLMVNPAKLAWGLAAAAERRGAVVHEHSRVTALRRGAGGVTVRVSGGGSVEADQVLIATSAQSAWLRRLTTLFVPVYDYVLVTEPLSAEQRAAIGWAGRYGMSDSGNRFHYFRLTADDRILWGGYDAIYHRGNRVAPEHDRRPETFAVLERNFRATFPALGGIGFSHRWGGAIDTTTRFCVTFGDVMGGRVHYALGYTGLGVGASRWAAGILRDKLLRPSSDLLRLRFVRSAPLPIPPEPLRAPVVAMMREAVMDADEHDGRPSLFLRAMDAIGVGFDS